MSGRAACLLTLLSLLCPGAAAAGETRCRECLYRGELKELFVPARSLGPTWETLEESPSDPQADPDLRAAGARATQSLHYTREMQGGGAEVCSVEIWSFGTPREARRARAGMEREGWRFTVLGNLVTMVRGVTFVRGSGLRPGLRPVCGRLGELIDARAAELLREPAGAASP